MPEKLQRIKKQLLKNRQFLSLFSIAFIIGILVWGGFNTILEQSNTMSFCISCHEMENNVYQEYKKTIHYANRTGVKAMCPDCHVPKEWPQMFLRKIMASKELFYKLTGAIDSREKFQQKRHELAQRVWASMQQSNSRECQNCHNYESMNFARQKSRSKNVHQFAHERGKTCIACHKGIAHQLPEGVIAEKGGSDADHLYYEKKKAGCYLCHPDMPKPIEEDWGF